MSSIFELIDKKPMLKRLYNMLEFGISTYDFGASLDVPVYRHLWRTDVKIGRLHAAQSVYHAVVMENVAEMGIKALLVNLQSSMPQYILDKHYFRKHGANVYYGQK